MEATIAFCDKNKFQDDVWGQIALNDLERDAIDTPEFQRLFRTSQLGFVRLVYQTANHTRGAHSIGACHIATTLIRHLVQNTTRMKDTDDRIAPIQISPAEILLIRLGALLHDVSHVPLSHDLERKTHKVFYRNGETLKLRSYYGHYDKHDDYGRNPLLYMLLCDTHKSVLARVLQRYSAAFYDLLREGYNEEDHAHLTDFLKILESSSSKGWNPAQQLLPSLLFHLLTYENDKDSEASSRDIAVAFDETGERVTDSWGLGPKELWNELHNSWYQPFRHDIIGNTLSADLIDYLRRDPQRLGMNRHIDLHLLNYYVLVKSELGNATTGNQTTAGRQYYRCAIDLHDAKRGTTRIGLLNDIFRLLDLRHEIHEKAVRHRVVHAANAMLSRALLLMGQRKPHPADLVRIGKRNHALQSEDTFFQSLLDNCEDPAADTKSQMGLNEARRIIEKLVDRRIYRPIMIIPGDRAANHAAFAALAGDERGNTEVCLRSLATIIDSAYYSPFFLFVSACIEQYLLGVIDTEAELCNSCKGIVDGDESPEIVQQAMELLPSRVVIWTTPYKQLYKDPAVVVALDNLVRPIDQLSTHDIADTSRNHSAIQLLRSSIQNADSKYAALWKLFVFISDGLFYTGILSKLQKDRVPDESETEILVGQHRSRLKQAQALLVAAFDVVCHNWSEFCEREPSIPQRESHLENRMNPDRFKSIVKRWISTYEDTDTVNTDRARGLSTVDIDHYAHGDPLHGSAGANCRDIRYKTDRSAAELWEKAKTSGSEGYDLVRFLKKTGMTDCGEMSELEFRQLLGLYQGEIQRVGAAAVQDVKQLWIGDFPWPLDRARTRTLSQTPQRQTSELLPKEPNQIRAWLRKESRVLQPNVRSQFNSDLDPLVSFIASLDPEKQEGSFADLLIRFDNESSLISNNIKVDQILGALRRKWGNAADES